MTKSSLDTRRKNRTYYKNVVKKSVKLASFYPVKSNNYNLYVIASYNAYDRYVYNGGRLKYKDLIK